MGRCIMSCVHHTYSPDKHGYGRRHHQGKAVLVHRLAYCEAHGLELSEIAGKVVRHQCDNPRCINPKHLIIGTQAENMRDMAERGRSNAPKGEAHKRAKLTESDVVWIRQHYKSRSKEFGAVALGRRFGVSHTAVMMAVKGETW